MSLCSEKRGGVISTTTKGTERYFSPEQCARPIIHRGRAARQGEYIYHGLSDSEWLPSAKMRPADEQPVVRRAKPRPDSPDWLDRSALQHLAIFSRPRCTPRRMKTRRPREESVRANSYQYILVRETEVNLR